RRRTDAASWWGSPPAQPRDEGACPGQLPFIIRCVWRMAAITHGFKRSIDLVECGLGHGGIPPPLGEEYQRNASIPKTRGPLQRHALARPFLQRLAIGRRRLLQPRRAALALTERLQRSAEIVLRHAPLQRHALAGLFLQRVAISHDGLFE